MNKFTKQDLLATGAAALVIVGAGTGIFFYADNSLPAQSPAPPQKVMTFWWTNAENAVISDVWGKSNLLMDWYYLGRYTNQNWIHRTNIPIEFYRVSHPQMVGHYWDANVWRVNHQLLNIPTNR